MKFYIAGPMTGVVKHNFPAFDHAKSALISQGLEAVSPADVNREHGYDTDNEAFVNGQIDQAEYQAVFKLDIAEILQCDAMLMLPGWCASKGAKIEAQLAWMIGMPLFRFIPNNNEIVPITAEEYDFATHVFSDGQHLPHDWGVGEFDVPRVASGQYATLMPVFAANLTK